MIRKALSNAYKMIWVPLFGRIVFYFVKQIEGKEPIKRPDYKIDYTEENIYND